MPEHRESIRRLRPTPEQFRAAFGVGAADSAIHPADAIGVPLAAIQGLHSLVERNRREIEELRVRLELAEHPEGPRTP
jgi:hypothetical protein